MHNNTNWSVSFMHTIKLMSHPQLSNFSLKILTRSDVGDSRPCKQNQVELIFKAWQKFNETNKKKREKQYKMKATKELKKWSGSTYVRNRVMLNLNSLGFYGNHTYQVRHRWQRSAMFQENWVKPLNSLFAGTAAHQIVRHCLTGEECVGICNLKQQIIGTGYRAAHHKI